MRFDEYLFTLTNAVTVKYYSFQSLKLKRGWRCFSIHLLTPL